MKVEKKIIALSIVALVIGIVTILPLAYIPYKAGDTTTTPVTDVGMILYAHTVPDPKTINTVAGNGEIIDIIARFTLTPNAANIKADAQIDVYNFHIYSDKTSIANITYCIAIDKNLPDSNSKSGFIPAIRGSGDGFWEFNDGTKFDIKDVIGYTEGNGQSGARTNSVRWTEENGYSYSPEGDTIMQRGYFTGSFSAFLYEAKDERSAQAVNNLQNAQTLYIDVTRIMTVTYQHQPNSSDSTTPTASSITLTSTNKKVICSLELAKTDWGFASGPVPNFMQEDTNYRHRLPPSAFSNPDLPREEYRSHSSILDLAGDIVW
jgi:hypothetical protein